MMINPLFWNPLAKAAAQNIGTNTITMCETAKQSRRAHHAPPASSERPAVFLDDYGARNPASIHNSGYSATREQVMADFKA